MSHEVQSDWVFQSFADYLETHELQNHSSRVVYDDADDPIVEIPDPTP